MWFKGYEGIDSFCLYDFFGSYMDFGRCLGSTKFAYVPELSVESGAGECVLKTYLRDYDDDVTDPIITRDVTQCWLYCRSIRC